MDGELLGEALKAMASQKSLASEEKTTGPLEKFGNFRVRELEWV